MREHEKWEQFHTPKNLAISIAIEAVELLEIFQWLTDSEAFQVSKSKKNKALVEEEMADVFIYLIRLADVLGVDLASVAEKKIGQNAIKYPIEVAKGNAIKYSRRRT